MNRLKHRVALGIGTGLVALLVLAAAVKVFAPAPAVSISYSTLLTELGASKLDSLVVVPGREILAWRGADRLRAAYTAAEVEPLVARAMAAGTAVGFRSGGGDTRTFALVGAVLLVAAGAIAFRHRLGGPSAQTDLGARSSSRTTFADVAGNGGAVSDLREVVSFLQDGEKFARIGARAPRGILLYGPPGTGKTLMARAVAGEAGVPFWTISGSEVTGFIVGLGALRIKSLFRKARRQGGVIFIDELDALGGKRGRNQSHNEDDRTLNQLLVEMDGFTPSQDVVVIAATNRPDDLDAALLRPGRFDRSVAVGLPTSAERKEILGLHVRNRRVPLAAGVDLGRLARLTPQTSGADLANLVNEAAIVAAREDAGTVNWSHVEAARDRMLLGKERSNLEASSQEWRIVAMHEAGHALLGVRWCPEDPLHKVTILPRGQAMGVAYFAPDSDRHLHSKRYLEGQILKGLGGRAAEEVLFGTDQVTSGARSDLQHVTRIAREMIYHLGMGETAGLMVYDADAPPSDEVRALMDREVRALIDRLYQVALRTVRKDQAALVALGEALLEHETLDGVEAVELLGVGRVA
ncbi:MAG TPA: AAA family ATPase [Gemmatimonadales bacterium]|nr:AAA family ATPase [Gemmatimonadales bacterium]